MSFVTPAALWLLLVPAGLLVAYVVAQRLRRRYAARFTNLDLLASIAPKRPGWRRHISAALLLAGLVALVFAVARPETERRVPKEEATIVLAIDVSSSMQATDVSPSRIEAAQEAAERFAAKLPDGLQLGLVAFSGSASVVVAPTADHRAVADAVARLRLGPSTAIGEAIFASLDAVAATDQDAAAGDGTTVEKVPAHIVVMSDGTTTSGRPNSAAVAAAKEAGVPVSTIAYGTAEGTVQIQGRTISVPVDPDSLREIAQDTGGSFFEAASGDELHAVYDAIGSQVGYDTETQEITFWFAGIGLALGMLAAGAAIFWMSRIL